MRIFLALLAIGTVATPAWSESLADVIAECNRLTALANQIRQQGETEGLPEEALLRELEDLLPKYDEIDRRAEALCDRAPSELTYGEAADLALQGSVMQTLYLLARALHKRFPSGRGYAAVHDELVELPEFRSGRALANPMDFRLHFNERLKPPEPGPTWLNAPAQQAEEQLLLQLPAWATSTAKLTEQRKRLGVFLQALVAEHQRTRSVDLLGVHLLGKLHLVAGYCQGLAALTDDHRWAGLAQDFEALALRATRDPREMAALLDTSGTGGPQFPLPIPVFR